MAKRRMLKYDRCCKRCGTTPIYGHKYCGDCKKIWRRPTHPWFGDIPHAESRVRRANNIARSLRCCEACGGFFQPPVPSQRQLKGENNWGRFCSIQCCYEPSRQRTKLRDARARIVRLLSLRRTCPKCEKAFTAKTVRQKHCSHECRDRRDTETRLCKECGTAFEVFAGNNKKVFCCKKCAQRWCYRVERRKRRAIERGVKADRVNPLAVFERDGYRCQLCGYKTLKSKRGTQHPKAPELDHIQPLARGGEHTYRNTHCACHACNHAKRDGAGGQLLLIGEHV